MHPCLQIDEVVRNVVSQLGGHTSGAPQDLLALALTCKAFYEPAMDELWGTAANLRDLIGCLPEDARRVIRRRVFTSDGQPIDVDVMVMISESFCGTLTLTLAMAGHHSVSGH